MEAQAKSFPQDAHCPEVELGFGLVSVTWSLSSWASLKAVL